MSNSSIPIQNYPPLPMGSERINGQHSSSTPRNAPPNQNSANAIVAIDGPNSKSYTIPIPHYRPIPSANATSNRSTNNTNTIISKNNANNAKNAIDLTNPCPTTKKKKEDKGKQPRRQQQPQQLQQPPQTQQKKSPKVRKPPLKQNQPPKEAKSPKSPHNQTPKKSNPPKSNPQKPNPQKSNQPKQKKPTKVIPARASGNPRKWPKPGGNGGNDQGGIHGINGISGSNGNATVACNGKTSKAVGKKKKNHMQQSREAPNSQLQVSQASQLSHQSHHSQLSHQSQHSQQSHQSQTAKKAKQSRTRQPRSLLTLEASSQAQQLKKRQQHIKVNLHSSLQHQMELELQRIPNWESFPRSWKRKRRREWIENQMNRQEKDGQQQQHLQQHHQQNQMPQNIQHHEQHQLNEWKEKHWREPPSPNLPQCQHPRVQHPQNNNYLHQRSPKNPNPMTKDVGNKKKRKQPTEGFDSSRSYRGGDSSATFSNSATWNGSSPSSADAAAPTGFEASMAPKPPTPSFSPVGTSSRTSDGGSTEIMASSTSHSFSPASPASPMSPVSLATPTSPSSQHSASYPLLTQPDSNESNENDGLHGDHHSLTSAGMAMQPKETLIRNEGQIHMAESSCSTKMVNATSENSVALDNAGEESKSIIIKQEMSVPTVIATACKGILKNAHDYLKRRWEPPLSNRAPLPILNTPTTSMPPPKEATAQPVAAAPSQLVSTTAAVTSTAPNSNANTNIFIETRRKTDPALHPTESNKTQINRARLRKTPPPPSQELLDAAKHRYQTSLTCHTHAQSNYESIQHNLTSLEKSLASAKSELLRTTEERKKRNEEKARLQRLEELDQADEAGVDKNAAIVEMYQQTHGNMKRMMGLCQSLLDQMKEMYQHIEAEAESAKEERERQDAKKAKHAKEAKEAQERIYAMEKEVEEAAMHQVEHRVKELELQVESMQQEMGQARDRLDWSQGEMHEAKEYLRVVEKRWDGTLLDGLDGIDDIGDGGSGDGGGGGASIEVAAADGAIAGNDDVATRNEKECFPDDVEIENKMHDDAQNNSASALMDGKCGGGDSEFISDVDDDLGATDNENEGMTGEVCDKTGIDRQEHHEHFSKRSMGENKNDIGLSVAEFNSNKSTTNNIHTHMATTFTAHEIAVDGTIDGGAGGASCGVNVPSKTHGTTDTNHDVECDEKQDARRHAVKPSDETETLNNGECPLFVAENSSQQEVGAVRVMDCSLNHMDKEGQHESHEGLSGEVGIADRACVPHEGATREGNEESVQLKSLLNSDSDPFEADVVGIHGDGNFVSPEHDHNGGLEQDADKNGECANDDLQDDVQDENQYAAKTTGGVTTSAAFNSSNNVTISDESRARVANSTGLINEKNANIEEAFKSTIPPEAKVASSYKVASTSTGQALSDKDIIHEEIELEDSNDEDYRGLGRRFAQADDQSSDEEDSTSQPRRRTQQGPRQRDRQLRQEVQKDNLEATDRSGHQNQPTRAYAHRPARRTCNEMDSDDEELQEMISTHTTASGEFKNDWDVATHIFKMPRGSEVQRKWVTRTNHQGSILGKKLYCPQVGDSVVYIPRAHYDTVQKFPTGYTSPWKVWPTDFPWPVVRCKVSRVRYRFPYSACYNHPFRNGEQLRGVAIILTLDITHKPYQLSESNFPWPQVFVSARSRSKDLQFEVTMFECCEEDFIIPEYLYTWRLKMLQDAISENNGNVEGIILAASLPDDQGVYRANEDVSYKTSYCQLTGLAENDEGEFHFQKSGYNSLKIKWLDGYGEVDTLCVWDATVKGSAGKIPEVPSMSPETIKAVSATLDKVMKMDERIRECFYHPVDTSKYTDYLHMIEVPMYISLIQKRLKSNYYTNKYSVVSDMDLVKENCYKYNEDGNGLYALACRMVDEFRSLIDDIRESATTGSGFSGTKTQPTKTSPVKKPVHLGLRMTRPENAKRNNTSSFENLRSNETPENNNSSHRIRSLAKAHQPKSDESEPSDGSDEESVSEASDSGSEVISAVDESSCEIESFQTTSAGNEKMVPAVAGGKYTSTDAFKENGFFMDASSDADNQPVVTFDTKTPVGIAFEGLSQNHRTNVASENTTFKSNANCAVNGANGIADDILVQDSSDKVHAESNLNDEADVGSFTCKNPDEGVAGTGHSSNGKCERSCFNCGKYKCPESKCYKCGKGGHLRGNCPESVPTTAKGSSEDNDLSLNSASNSSESKALRSQVLEFLRSELLKKCIES